MFQNIFQMRNMSTTKMYILKILSEKKVGQAKSMFLPIMTSRSRYSKVLVFNYKKKGLKS